VHPDDSTAGSTTHRAPAPHALADILSVTTDRLMSRRGIAGIYDLLGHMTGNNLFTHELPEAARLCEPALLAQHPRLVGVTPPDGLGNPDLMAWLIEQERVYGETLTVAPLPRGEAVDSTDTPVPTEHLIPVGVALDVCGRLVDITTALHGEYVDLIQAALPHLPAETRVELIGQVERITRELPAAIAEAGAAIPVHAEPAT